MSSQLSPQDLLLKTRYVDSCYLSSSGGNMTTQRRMGLSCHRKRGGGWQVGSGRQKPIVLWAQLSSC